MYFVHITDAKVYLVFLFLATLGAGLFNLMIWAFMTVFVIIASMSETIVKTAPCMV